MRNVFLSLSAIILVMIMVIPTQGFAEDCVYCDNVVTGDCQDSQGGDPTYDDCEEDSVNCNHWGAFCGNLSLRLEATTDGTARYTGLDVPVIHASAEYGDQLSVLRTCSGEILARAYTPDARAQMDAGLETFGL